MTRRRRRNPDRGRSGSEQSAGVRHRRALPPGLYTALLAGQSNGTGVGLVEVYDRGAP